LQRFGSSQRVELKIAKQDPAVASPQSLFEADRWHAEISQQTASGLGSRDYNPSPLLEKIQARILAVNSADDERNPAELGVMEREIKRVKNGRYVLTPTSEETRGHGTTGLAKLWKRYLDETLTSHQ
jgi:hypothetical protein